MNWAIARIEALTLNGELAKLAIRAGNDLVQELDKVKYWADANDAAKDCDDKST